MGCRSPVHPSYMNVCRCLLHRTVQCFDQCEQRRLPYKIYISSPRYCVKQRSAPWLEAQAGTKGPAKLPSTELYVPRCSGGGGERHMKMWRRRVKSSPNCAAGRPAIRCSCHREVCSRLTFLLQPPTRFLHYDVASVVFPVLYFVPIIILIVTTVLGHCLVLSVTRRSFPSPPRTGTVS